jgi:hypothetical protein
MDTMAFINSRLKRLERRRWRQHPEGSHFIQTVQVPPEADTAAYLAEIPCPCGAGPQCPEKRFGLVVPTRCHTSEEWAARYAPYAAKRQAPDIANADLVVILNQVVDP